MHKQKQTTMKIKTKVETEVEVEINLPYFFQVESGSVHAVTENCTIRVWNDSIDFKMYSSAQFIGNSGNTEITYEEFTRILDERIEQIQNLKTLLNK